MIELFTALSFALVPVLYWPVLCIYILILIYDIRHKIIPDTLVYTSIGLAAVLRFAFGGTLADWLAGPVLFTIFALGWLVSKGRALGFGDAKLVLSIGLLLGASLGLSAVALAFWIGALVTVPFVISGYLLGHKSLTMKSEVPFAPFLILGAWGALVFHLDLFHLSSFI